MDKKNSPTPPVGLHLDRAERDGARWRLVASIDEDSGGACKHCGSSSNLRPWDRRVREFADLPFGDRAVVLEIHHRRVVCRACNCKPYVESIPAVHPRRSMTQRLVEWVVENSKRSSFAAMSRRTGVDERTLRDVFSDWVREQQQLARYRPQRAFIGIVSLRGAPRVFGADLDHGAVFAMTASVHEFFEVVGDWPIGACKYLQVDLDPRIREGVLDAWPCSAIAVDVTSVINEVCQFWDKHIIDCLRTNAGVPSVQIDDLRLLLAEQLTDAIPPMVVRSDELASARWEARGKMLSIVGDHKGGLFDNGLGAAAETCHPAIRFEWDLISARIAGLGDAMTRYRKGHRQTDKAPCFDGLADALSRRECSQARYNAVIQQALCDDDQTVRDSAGARVGFDPVKLASRLTV